MQKYKGWIRYTDLKEDTDITLGQEILSKVKDWKDNTHSAQEQADEELKDYTPEVMKCLANGKKHFNGNFYIEVLFCYDKVLPGKRKNIFAARESCPTPFYDQAVYKYTKSEDKLEFLWIVPDIDLCELYRYNIEIVPDEEKMLYENICAYHNGDLAKREYFENNKEKKIEFSMTRS